jgi:type I restriction enzyme M protein
LWQQEDSRISNDDLPLKKDDKKNLTFGEWKNLLLELPIDNRQSQMENLVYRDIKGFCKSVTIEEVRELDYVLTPGRYVGLPEQEDDFDFEERFSKLKAEFMEQLKEEERLNKLILENLERIEIPDKVHPPVAENPSAA